MAQVLFREFWRKADVAEDVFEHAKKINQEASIIVTGLVKREERAPYCGYELHLDGVQLVSDCPKLSHNEESSW